MAEFLDEADFTQVRAALDLDLTETGLSDETIRLDIYTGRTNAVVARRVSAFDDLSIADQAIAKRAAILYAASLLAPVLTHLDSVSFDDVSLRYKKDWDALADQLRADYEDEIEEVTGVTQAVPPAFFGRVKGRRGL